MTDSGKCFLGLGGVVASHICSHVCNCSLTNNSVKISNKGAVRNRGATTSVACTMRGCPQFDRTANHSVGVHVIAHFGTTQFTERSIFFCLFTSFFDCHVNRRFWGASICTVDTGFFTTMDRFMDMPRRFEVLAAINRMRHVMWQNGGNAYA